MELARLRSALGEGQLELEIDKLRALLGAVEADVRLLRQVKNEEAKRFQWRFIVLKGRNRAKTVEIH